MLDSKKYVADFDLVKEWINSEDPSTVLKGSSRRFLWKCLDCSNEWLATPYNRIKNNSGCPKCSRKSSSEKRVAGYLKKYGSIYDSKAIKFWDYEKNIYDPKRLTSRTRIGPLFWICDLSHRWETNGCYGKQKVGCPYCSNRKVLIGFNDLLTTNPEVDAFWDYNLNNKGPEEYTRGSGKKVYWICKNRHPSYSSIKNKLRNINKCRECSHLKSYFEVQVREYIKSSYPNIVFLENTKPISLKGRKLELDFYFPEIDLAIEVQDNSTHDKYSDDIESLFYGKKIIKKGPKYHNDKRILARDKLNCNLIEIWEDDFKSDNFKKIIDSVILEALKVGLQKC